MGKVKKYRRMLPRRILPMILCLAMLCACAYTAYLRFNAATIGGDIGSNIGSLVGTAIGSFEGITKGREAGTEAGREQGLSAEDTEAEIANTIHEVQNLEVLVASVQLSDFHTIGDEEDPAFAALYLLNGQVVFSVDLSQAEITVSGSETQIILPEPTAKLIRDPSRIKRAAVYQNKSWTGTTEAGFEEYINSLDKLTSESVIELEQYSQLLEQAELSAVEQVTNLVEAASISDRKITVDFAESES